jgi:hypothetical protein
MVRNKTKKKYLGILAIHNVDNYGAILQSLAFYKYINKFTDAKIINFQNPVLSSHLKLIRYSGLSSWKSCFKDLIRIRKRYKLLKKFKNFIKKNFKLTKSVNLKCLYSKSFLKNFDALVVSSDQVWNPDITHADKKLRGDYFLNTNINKNLNKFSYASSFGSRKFNNTEINDINFYLSKFDLISIREKEALKYINKRNKKKTFHVADPVFLQDKKFWLNLIKNKKPLKRKKFILVYSVARSKLIKEAVINLNKNLNFEVITIDPNLQANTKYDYKISDAGPEDFLYFYKNCSFVVTDSFHGVCFSLIFEKKFLCVASDGIYSNRLTDLLSYLNCEKNIYDNSSAIKKINNYKISNDSKKKLNKFIKKSKFYLNLVIKKINLNPNLIKNQSKCQY